MEATDRDQAACLLPFNRPQAVKFNHRLLAGSLVPPGQLGCPGDVVSGWGHSPTRLPLAKCPPKLAPDPPEMGDTSSNNEGTTCGEPTLGL